MDKEKLAEWAQLTREVLAQATGNYLAHEYLALAKYLSERAVKATDADVAADLWSVAGELYLAWQAEE